MKRHVFDPGYTGMSTNCNQLVLDKDGAGTECGEPRTHPIHRRAIDFVQGDFNAPDRSFRRRVHWRRGSGGWVRIGKRRLALLNHKVQPPLFSERQGYVPHVHIGDWCLRFLPADLLPNPEARLRLARVRSDHGPVSRLLGEAIAPACTCSGTWGAAIEDHGRACPYRLFLMQHQREIETPTHFVDDELGAMLHALPDATDDTSSTFRLEEVTCFVCRVSLASEVTRPALRSRVRAEFWPANKGGYLNYDPTYGRIDRDIQWRVHDMDPTGVGQRVAIENTLQEKRRMGGS